jgi:hypothetical protein
VDTSRVLAYRTGLELDIAKHHVDADRRAAANRWCSLVTPVIKSICTHQAFHGASECLQVFGGHGYVKEWGVEQIVRDSRVAMIYEGTNEIQAIDLLVRKVLPDGGVALNALLDDLLADSAWTAPSASLVANANALRKSTAALVAANGADASKAYWVAGDFLRATGLVLLQWAAERLAAAGTYPGSGAGTPQAFKAWVLPELGMRLEVMAGQLSHQ